MKFFKAFETDEMFYEVEVKVSVITCLRCGALKSFSFFRLFAFSILFVKDGKWGVCMGCVSINIKIHSRRSS